MDEGRKEHFEPLSEQEIAKAEALREEIKRKLLILLEDPETPETFKEAFSDMLEEKKW